MITKEFTNNFVTKIKDCFKIEDKWNNTLFKNNENWKDVLSNRSLEYRKLFNVNEELISELKNNIHHDLSALEVDYLFDAMKELFYSACDDYIIFKLIAEPIKLIFKTIGDYNRLIFTLHVLAYEETLFYLEGNLDHELVGLDYYYGIFKYQDKYNLINRESRLIIFKSYYNLLLLIFTDIHNNFNQYFQIRQRALGLWYSKIVQDIDGKDEEFLYYIDKITSNVFKIDGLDRLSKENIQILRMTFNKYNTKKLVHTDYDTTCGIRYKLDYYDKIIDIDLLIYELTRLYDYSYEKFNYNDINLIDYYDTLDDIIGGLIDYYDDNLSNNLKDIIIKYVYKHKELLSKASYSYFTSESNYMVYRFYQKAYRLLGNIDNKIDFILSVIMYREPITYIHSLMVKSISSLICNKLIDNKPELFLDTFDFKNIDDVKRNKDKIIKYIENASLLHDVGKTTCVRVIKTQTRRLDDVEFNIIKKHPENGRKVLCNDSDFKNYYDIIEGHHKFYDGSYGYPKEFDNTKSEFKIYIDIVSIADSCDAATDIYGRNYTNGKTFNNLLDELKKDSCVKYNPNIVDYISSDTNLINELIKLTTDGRIDVYDYVYSKYNKI